MTTCSAVWSDQPTGGYIESPGSQCCIQDNTQIIYTTQATMAHIPLWNFGMDLHIWCSYTTELTHINVFMPKCCWIHDSDWSHFPNRGLCSLQFLSNMTSGPEVYYSYSKNALSNQLAFMKTTLYWHADGIHYFTDAFYSSDSVMLCYLVML